MKIKYTVILLFTAAISWPYGNLNAQNEAKPVVAGQVVDAAGLPINEALICDASGKIITTTDKKGCFTAETSQQQLQFLATGYHKTTLNAEKAMKITLKPDRARLDDLLDYGYGIHHSRQTTSAAVATLDGKRLEDIPTSNFSQMLEGQLLGLGTLEKSSDPGAASVTEYIRGISTINNTTPLVVIDGVEMQEYNLDYLTAAEVESIVLLKDAAATAIYGLKGVNGVLVIQTKSGLPGAFDVKVTTDFSMQQFDRKPQHISSYKYAQLRNEAWANDGSKGEAPYSDDQISRIRSGNDPLYPNNNFYNDFTRKFGTMERIGISLSGGSQRTRVWSNLNVMNQTPLFKHETDEYVATPRRFWVNFRARIDVDISKHVSAFASIAGNVRNDRLAGGALTNTSIYNSIFSLPPTLIGPTTEDGRVTTLETVGSPTYGILNRSGYTKYTGMYAATQVGLTVNLDFITRGLSATGKLAFQSSNDRYNYSSQDYKRYYYDYTAGTFVQLGSNLDSSLTNSADGKFQYALNYIAQIDYKRAFGQHQVEAHLYSYYTDEQFDKVDASYPAVGMSHYSHTVGLNAAYNYRDRYILNATAGLAASDVFARKNRYNFTPAVSAAWILSNESFLKEVGWLNLLKVRASYGVVALDNFQVGNYRYLYRDYILKSGEIRILGNPDLKAEKHKIQNYGLDLGLWNQLNLTFNYFYNRTDNMLIESGNRIPSYQGIYTDNYRKVNEGKMENRGVELGLDYTRSINKDWTVRGGIEWAHSKNKVLSTHETPYPAETSSYSGYAYTHRSEGYPYGQQFGYLIDRSKNGGYITTDAELAQYTAMYAEIGTPRKGDFIYRDLNKDGVVNQKDMAPIGKGSIPTDFTTFRIGFGWKGLDVDLMLQGVTGYYGSVAYATETTASGIYNDLHLKAWTAERAASGHSIKAPALSYNTQSTSTLQNNYLVANRSFWRLKNASIAYTLPQSLLGKTGIKRLKIVLSGINLFTLTKLDSKVIDPETGSMTAMPPMRVFNLGVKLDF